MFPGTAGRGRGGSGPPSSGRSSLAPGSGRPSLGSGRPSVGMQPFAAPGRRPSAAPSAGGGSRRSSVAPASGRGPPSSNASPRGSSAGSDLGAAYYQSGHPTSEKSTEFIGTQLHAIQQELAQRKADSQRMREELAQPLSTVPTAEDYAHYTAVKQQMELQHHNAMTAEQRRHVDLTRSWTQAYEARKKQLDRILPDDNMWLSPDAVDVELHRALQSRTAMLATADPAAVPKRTFKGSSKLARLLIRYPALERYHHGEVDWLSFWVNDLGGLRGMGPGGITEEELTLIVATDERTVYRLPVPPQARQVGNQLAPPPPTPPLGFFEVILSQLPNLLRCSLRASRYDFSRLDCMARAPRPFPSLCTLDLSGTAINTTQLQDLSRWMAHPELLFELSLANCHGITDLSKALLAFEGLKRLDLSGSGVDSLAWLVTSCPKLKSLDLRRCASLKKLSGLSAGPRRLRRLALSCINGVLDVSWVSSTTPTEYLTVEDCNSTVDYKTLRGLYRLKFLSLTCEGNIPLRWIASCQLLTCVYVFFNSPVTGVLDLAPFAELRSLTTLYLRGSDSMDLSMLSTASKVPTIEELHITGNAFVTDLEPLRRLSSLQRLYVTYAGAVELLQLSGCVSLVELYISCTEELSGFHHLRNLRLLRKLCIRSPEGVDLGSGIEHLSTLEELDLSGCPLQQNLRPISRIKSLRRLHVGGTPEERDSNLDFKMLKSLSHLTVLGVSGAALNKKSRKQLDLE